MRSGAVRVGSAHSTAVVSTKTAGANKATKSPLFAAIGLTTTVTGSGSVFLVANNRKMNRRSVVAVSTSATAPNTPGKGTTKTAFTSPGTTGLHTAVASAGNAGGAESPVTDPSVTKVVLRTGNLTERLLIAPGGAYDKLTVTLVTTVTAFTVTVITTEYTGDTLVTLVIRNRNHTNDFGPNRISSGDGSVILTVLSPGVLVNIIHGENIGASVSLKAHDF